MCPTERPGCEHHYLIFHSVTLSWHWANQSLPCHNNLKHLARKRQVSILKSFVLHDKGSNPPTKSEYPNLLKRLIGSTPTSYLNGRQTLNSFGHPIWSAFRASKKEYRSAYLKSGCGVTVGTWPSMTPLSLTVSTPCGSSSAFSRSSTEGLYKHTRSPHMLWLIDWLVVSLHRDGNVDYIHG